MGEPRPEPYNRDRGVMLIRPKPLFFHAVCLAAAVFLSTCGIETYYYLPQVPERNIQTIFNTTATMNLPSLDEFHDIRPYYLIYYRIYTSGSNESGTINTDLLRRNVNTVLDSDYNAIYPNTDPTNTSSGTPANTLFSSRRYFELELEGVNIRNILTEDGGNIRFSFPTEQGGYPVLSLNGGPEYRLYRSGYFFSINPNDDKRFFRNTPELNSQDYADLVYRDLSPHAYVSMYIVAAGTNTSTFTPIYSKPTFINVFKLPNY
jgi:hypothetical protein